MYFKNISIIDENFEYREHMNVGTMCNGRIVYVGSEPATQEVIDMCGEVYEGEGKLLMSGFYNAHGHSPMTLMRGYGENMALHDWLTKLVFPFEDQLYDDAVYYGTLLAMAESFMYGIVSTSDMYFFIDAMVKAISVSGAKANISRSVVALGCPVEENRCIQETEESIIMYHGWDNGRILMDTSIHAEYTNTDETVDAVVALAKKHDLNMHVHVAETEFEVQGCKERHNGMTPVEYLNSRGVFDVPTTAAHCVVLSDKDIDILKEKNVTVACNPLSNLKLVSGMCEIKKLYDKGVNVAIATDSVTSNNSLDYIEEMKAFTLVGKLKSQDPAAMKPEQVLYSATRAGALAQGRNDCGLLKEGYKADLIVMDVNVPNMKPVYNMLHNIIYSASGKDILLTMVDGKVVYRDGKFTTIDIDNVYIELEKARQTILEKLGKTH